MDGGGESGASPIERGQRRDGEPPAEAGSGRDWLDWHAAYDQPGSTLSWRLGVIQDRIRQTLDRLPAGPIRAISLCAGQGRDLIGALVGHPRAIDVSAQLVELDPDLVEFARRSARGADLPGIEVVTRDASETSAYVRAVPAQLILACGIFGNITDADVKATVRQLPSLAAPEATVIWTRHRCPPDLTVHIRSWFADDGFEEVAFDPHPGGFQAVGTHRLIRQPDPYRAGEKMFDFVGYDQLAKPHQ